VTALSSCGPFLVAAEGPFLRFYTREEHNYISSRQVFQSQAIHGIAVLSASDQFVKLVVWGGLLVRAVDLSVSADATYGTQKLTLGALQFSKVSKAPDWILDLSPRAKGQEKGANDGIAVCAAVTAHNALLELSIRQTASGNDTQRYVSWSDSGAG
jgi:hypothetical protein